MGWREEVLSVSTSMATVIRGGGALVVVLLLGVVERFCGKVDALAGGETRGRFASGGGDAGRASLPRLGGSGKE